MNQKVVTAIEILVILGLILVVLAWGGMFTPAPPAPTVPPSPTPVPTATPIVPPQSLIAFTNLREDNFDIYVVKTDGSGLRNLTDHPAQDLLPAWSPDGARIAFFSSRTGWPEIYVIQADGSGLMQITHGQELNATYTRLAWSPDGQRIAAVWADGQQNVLVGPLGPFVLELIESDGSAVRQVFQSDEELTGPLRWAPDGRYLGLSQTRVTPESGTLVDTALIDMSGSQAEPALSIGSCLIAGWFPSDGQVLCRIFGTLDRRHQDGTGATVLVDSISDGTAVALSPDGRYILYENSLSRVAAGSVTQLLNLVDTRAPWEQVQVGIPIQGTVGMLSWGPDSHWFTYDAGSENRSSIYITSIDDPANPRRLTDDAGYGYAPQWQPGRQP
jgi:Tol biopolymer transport system component